MSETNAMGLGQDLGLLSVLRFVRWLAGYRFSCCDFYLIRTDLKSAVGSRLIWLVWHESSIFPETIFKPTGSARPKFRIFFVARFRPCVGRSKIKRVIKLRLFKTADVFVGANRRTECKIFVVAFGQFVRIVSTFNLATSRSYFEDYTYIFSAEERLFCDFGLYEAADKSINVCRFSKRVLRLLR